MDGKQEHPQHQKYVEYIQMVEFYRTKSPTVSIKKCCQCPFRKSIVLVNTQVIRFYVDQRKFVQDERLETFHQNSINIRQSLKYDKYYDQKKIWVCMTSVVIYDFPMS